MPFGPDIRQLNIVTVDGPRNSIIMVCPICQEDLDKKSPEGAYIDCMHWYHFQCISEWTRRGNHDCPQCKHRTKQIFKVGIKDLTQL